MSKKAEKSGAIKALVALAAAVLVAGALLNYQTVRDFVVANSFVPTEELLEVEGKLKLTDEGQRVFRASTPTLDSKTEFNENCGVDRAAETSVLGCYEGGKIHILKITATEFAGIVESTAAHELLHATWGRMNDGEKAELEPVLETVLKNSSDDFKQTLEPYAENLKLEEIYVRAATQIKTLPEVLEKHYATIFADQDAIVGYYNSYIQPFTMLKNQLANLSAEMENLKTEIESTSVIYEQSAAQFSENVAEFNRCAETTNCFTAATFNARRAELLAQKAVLDQQYQSLNAKITEYNQKVEAYNSQVIYGQNLQNIINSNSKATSL